MHFSLKIPRSLKFRMIILVSVPMLFEMLLLGKLSIVQSRAEQSLRSAKYYSEELRALNELNLVFLESNAEFLEAKVNRFNLEKLIPKVRNSVSKVEASLAEVRQILKDDPYAVSVLDEIILLGDQLAVKIRTQARLELSGASTELDRKNASRDISIFAQNAFAALIQLQKDVQVLQYQRYTQGVQIKAEASALLVDVAVLNAVLVVLSIAVLSNAASKRLQSLLSNVRKYASDQPLSVPSPGDDEIAFIEESFYKTAEALRTARRKEKAFIYESYDPIIFVSADLRIQFANEAAREKYAMATGLELAERVSITDKCKEFFEKVRRGDKTTLQVEIIGTPEQRYAIMSAVWEVNESCYLCIVHDITERIQIEQMRSDLVSMFTHDLKSPLTALKLNVGKLAEGPLSEKQFERVGKVQISISKMSRLVSDLLDLYKTDAGMMQFNCRSIDIQLLAESARHELLEVAESAQIPIITEYDGNNKCVAHADPEASERVIVNLLSNAIRYSPEGAPVGIGVKANIDTIEVSITDNGPGISDEELPHLFQRFRRLSAKSNSTNAGLSSGLGLAICKSFAEKQGGKVIVSSRLQGGSTFTFLLPRAPLLE